MPIAPKPRKGKIMTLTLEQPKTDITPSWTDIVTPSSTNLIIGTMGSGKTGLSFHLLERLSQRFELFPIIVGYPRKMKHLMPPRYLILDTLEEAQEWTDSIIFVDEGDIQIPLENAKMRKHVVNLLSLPRQRNQILLLAFHFPRLVLSRYLPYFSSIIIKRPPFLLEFASKGKNDVLMKMMETAESHFRELPINDTQKHSYVVASQLRWQGMISNPLPSFWSNELSRAWALNEE